MTRIYQPLLEDLGITYPQYLILMVLWEEESASVTELGNKLMLSSNTLTPLLKRMEKNGILKRARSKKDERKVLVTLTEKGHSMRKAACSIPEKLQDQVAGGFSNERIVKLRDELKAFIETFKDR